MLARPIRIVGIVACLFVVVGWSLFAIDQAQYMQGYLAVVYMTQYLKTGAIAPGSAEGVTLTGPQFVTKDNAAAVIKYTQEGVR